MATALGQECHICLEELRRELAAAPCGHVFHHVCVLQALQVHAQCPICRRAVRDADLVPLYFDVPSVLGAAGDKALDAAAASTSAALDAAGSSGSGGGGGGAPSDETRKLSARVNALMERVQWQKKQSEVLLGELERLRDQNEQLVRDKQALAQRAAALESTKVELLGKVGKYQAELSRQAEAARRASINRSIAKYLDTCDADAMEEEIRNPRELIVALKKACKFRHEQYQKVVKDKARLAAALQQQQQQRSQTGGKGKAPAAAYEGKRASPAELSGGPPGLHFGSLPPEPKKRRMGSPGASGVDAPVFASRPEPAAYRADAYSDVPVRPAAAGRMHTLGRSSYNPNQYGVYQLTPAANAPVLTGGADHVVCRRGYDGTGKLTNFFLPKQSGPAAAGMGMAAHASAALQAGMQRPKAAPSMRSLLNEDEYAPAAAPSRDARAFGNAGDRREYSLTSWLRRG